MELSILAEVKHENIVRVYQLLHDQDHYIIVMELLSNGTLLQYIQHRNQSAQGPMPESQIQ